MNSDTNELIPNGSRFSPLGTKYVYSNFGYMLLGRVIARVSGRSYESYIQSLLREVNITNVHLGRSLREEKHQDEVTASVM